MKERITYIDQLKGIAIITVVMMHLYCFSSEIAVQCLPSRILYSYAMPLFMMLSGFFAKFTIMDKWLFIKKKTISLLLPYFTVGGLYSLLMTNGDITSIFTFHYRAGYWYLLSLYLIHISVWCGATLLSLFKSLDYNKREWMNIGVYTLIWLSLVYIVPLFYPRVSLLENMPQVYMPYFLCGFLLNKYIDKLKDWVIPILLVVYLCIFSIEHKSSELACVSSMSISVCIIYAIYKLENCYKESIVHKFLDKVGRVSLSVYVFHYFLIYGIPDLTSVLTCGNTIISFWISLAISLLIVVPIIILDCFISSNKYLKLLILGKS